MRIAYVGPFSFPSSNANSLRVKGISEALVQGGHEVVVCPGLITTESTGANQTQPGHFIYQLDEYKGGFCSGLPAGIRGLFLGDITLRWLESLEHKPDTVILYGTPLGYLLRLLPFCKKHGILFFLDVVEWHDPRHLPGGAFGPFAIANELSMRYVAKKADGIFTISRYLQEHFASQGCKTFRVPPLFSFEQTRPMQFREVNGMLNLCYSGSPGQKEDMRSIFHGLQLAHDAGIPFMMHIVGLTANEFTAAFGMQELSIIRDINSVKFYGKLENIEARHIISSCDFQVTLRKDARFTRAGFPSKVAESLSLGTPIIGNLSSNLGDYLSTDVNSILVTQSDAVSLISGLHRAASLSSAEYKALQENAIKCALFNFRPENYSTQIDVFLKGEARYVCSHT